MIVEVHGREVVQLPYRRLVQHRLYHVTGSLSLSLSHSHSLTLPLSLSLSFTLSRSHLVVVEVHGREVVQLPVPLFLLHLLEPKSFS